MSVIWGNRSEKDSLIHCGWQPSVWHKWTVLSQFHQVIQIMSSTLHPLWTWNDLLILISSVLGVILKVSWMLLTTSPCHCRFMHEANFFILKQMMNYLESFGCWDSVEILPVCLRFQFKPNSWGQRGEREQVTVSPSSGCSAELRALSSSVIFAERLRWPGFHPRQPWHQRSLVVVLWTSLEKPKQISSCATAPLDQSQSSQLPVGFASSTKTVATVDTKPHRLFPVFKRTLYVNMRSFASSCTAGFHGEKLERRKCWG